MCIYIYISSDLDALRTKGPVTAVEVAATWQLLPGGVLVVNATLGSAAGAPAVAFACRVSLR